MLANRHEASTAILATVLLFDVALEQIITEHGLRPEHMASAQHAALLAEMIAMKDAGEKIDDHGLMLKARLEPRGNRQPWRGTDHVRHAVDELVAAAADVPMVNEIPGYVRLLKDEAEWEQRNGIINTAIAAIHGRDTEAFTAAIGRLDDIGARDESDIVTTEQLGSEFIDWYESPDTGAIPTPFPAMNELLGGGFLPGATTVLGAWSSMGKSILVDQCAGHVTQPDVGKRSCVYTNEMVRETRTARTISRMTGVPFKKIMRKQLDTDELSKVADAAGKLPFPIKEIGGWSAADIARHVRRHRWDVWVVDLVTRIPARDTADWDAVSSTLTDVALQTSTHGILVCQLNQQRNQTMIKPPPVQRDLRNTGAWYNDATNVVFLHREQEEVTVRELRPGGGYEEKSTGTAQVLSDGHIHVEKSRNDQPGLFAVTLNPRTMGFEPLSRYSLAQVA